MVGKVANPEKKDPLVTMQDLYFRDFHEKVAEKREFIPFYGKIIDVSGVLKKINGSKETVNIADVGSGSGMLERTLRTRNPMGEFNVFNIDIDKDVFFGNPGEIRITAEMRHLPLSDKTMDFVYFVNMPNPVRVVENYMEKTKPGSIKELADNYEVFCYLEDIRSSVFRLDVFEGIRVLKDGGTMTFATWYKGPGSRGVESTEVQLKPVNFEIFELDKEAAEYWKRYLGVSVVGKEFFCESSVKTGDVKMEDTVRFQKNLKESNDGLKDIKRFWEIIQEIEIERKAKEKMTSKVDKKDD